MFRETKAKEVAKATEGKAISLNLEGDNVVERNSQNVPSEEWHEAVSKQFEAEVIAEHEMILKAKYLSHKTDINTIPFVKVDVENLSLSELPWGKPCDPDDKINPATPVVLGRDYDVIAGAHQYYYAKENNIDKIDAVFVDSLPRKYISISNLKKQLKDESICTSFAFNLYALLYGREYIIGYDEFCKEADNIFDRDEIWMHLHRYISLLNEDLGV